MASADAKDAGDIEMQKNELFDSKASKQSSAAKLANQSRGRLLLKETLKPCKPVCIEWDHLSVKVDVEIDGSEAPGMCAQKPKEKRAILNNLSGRAAPGDMVAIMGSSGAGKTTFLNVVAQRNTKMEGQLRANGRPIDPETYAQNTAYVMQEDLFLGNLTCYEHLFFTGMLRLDQTLEEEQVAAQVEQLLKAMGLWGVRNNVIGNVGRGLQRGISGGERKRLAFASEIITDPPVFFADEPTSGLDSAKALNIVMMMKQIAEQGRTVLATIHQPSSQIYNEFNYLCLIHKDAPREDGTRPSDEEAGGHIVYYGPREEAIPYFASIDPSLECPEHFNPADWWLLALEHTTFKAKELADRFRASDVHRRMQQRTIPTYGQVAVASGAAEASGSKPTEVAALPASAPKDCEGPGVSDSKALGALDSRDHIQAPWCKQCCLLQRRSFAASSRDPLLTYARLGQTLIIALIAGLIFLRLKNNQQGVQDRNGGIFFILINQSMSSVFGVLQSFPLEKPVLRRELEAGSYRSDTWYISRSVSEVSFQFFFPILFCSIVFWMMGLRDDFGVFLAFTGIVLLASNTAFSLGYMISALAPSVEIALAIGPVTILPLFLFSGFFINTESLPVYFIWLEYFSFFKYGFSALAIVTWDGVDIPCESGESCLFANGGEVLDYLNLPPSNLIRDLAVLAGMTVGFRVLAYVFLVLGMRGKANE